MKFLKRKSKETPEPGKDYSGKSVPGQEADLTRRSNFRSIIDMSESLLLGLCSPVQKAAIFDYMIWALGCQIAADGHGIFVSGDVTPENLYYDIAKIFPKMDSVYQGKKFFDVSKLPTYTGPWDLGRFPEALLSLLKKGYQHTEASNNGIYYVELGFAVMGEGRHHTSWSVYLGSCIEALEVVTLEPYFPIVQTDGAYFIYTNSDGIEIRNKAIDYRFAAMYRLAQMRWELGYPIGTAPRLADERIQIEEDGSKCLQDILKTANLPDNTRAVYDYYVKENDRLKIELNLCRQERDIEVSRCVQKSRRIAELEQQLASSPQIEP